MYILLSFVNVDQEPLQLHVVDFTP